MRGHDMTLRQFEQKPADPDEQAAQGDQKEEAINAWRILIAGYIRQFEYVAERMAWHSGYYDEKDMVVFYAQEVVRRLTELSIMLEKTQNLKDFDAMIDANKAFVPAMRKNITNLFSRLMELLKARATVTAATSSSSGLGDTESRSRSGRSSMSFLDDEYPRSMHH